MNKYLVDLFEHKNDEEVIIFVCWADDKEHAVEQALDAYKEGYILSVFDTGVEYEKSISIE